ncbi:MAG: aminoacyl--tRNA ligase-related protein [bacterium]
MRQSKLFTKITKDLPKDETSFNAQVLIRAGFIDKLAAGIYSYLPLGLLVLNKINKIVREEMNAIGGQEILMPALNPKEIWEATGRWSSLDVLFKLKGDDNKEYALGATHEEVVTPLAQKHIMSYKELPQYVYQIQTKYRNEKRAKAGLIRGREFVMKDLYSFHTNEEDLNEYYKLAQKAYFKVYERCGLLNQTYLTFASGGSFSKYSHEFQTVTDAGEDTIYICEKCSVAINDEIINEQTDCPLCHNKVLKKEKSVEVGNIFKLKTKYSAAFGFNYKDKNGDELPVEMGCYGIGPSRLMATVVEVHHDERGIIWPEEIAPFKVHLISVGIATEELVKVANGLYDQFKQAGIEVLFDDREISAGQKFMESDMIGCPYRVVISSKTLLQNKVELKKRHESEFELVKLNKIVEAIR